MGRRWYEDGKYLRKTNTFTDFVACAEHLITEKYTSSRRLCIQGRSAGGAVWVEWAWMSDKKGFTAHCLNPTLPTCSEECNASFSGAHVLL